MVRLAEIAGDECNDSGRTFVFTGESHTLGNVLKSIISGYPEVQFCGYTIPHPSEDKLHFRIQVPECRAVDILKRGLEDLEEICNHTINMFQQNMEAFITANKISNS